MQNYKSTISQIKSNYLVFEHSLKNINDISSGHRKKKFYKQGCIFPSRKLRNQALEEHKSRHKKAKSELRKLGITIYENISPSDVKKACNKKISALRKMQKKAKNSTSEEQPLSTLEKILNTPIEPRNYKSNASSDDESLALVEPERKGSALMKKLAKEVKSSKSKKEAPRIKNPSSSLKDVIALDSSSNKSNNQPKRYRGFEL